MVKKKALFLLTMEKKAGEESGKKRGEEDTLSLGVQKKRKGKKKKKNRATILEVRIMERERRFQEKREGRQFCINRRKGGKKKGADTHPKPASRVGKKERRMAERSRRSILFKEKPFGVVSHTIDYKGRKESSKKKKGLGHHSGRGKKGTFSRSKSTAGKGGRVMLPSSSCAEKGRRSHVLA